MEGIETQSWTRDLLDKSMVLLDNIVQILDP